MSLDVKFFISRLREIVFWAIGTLFLAAAIKISWRMVGGRASFNSILLTHLYGFSGFLLISACYSLIFAGLIAIFYPGYYSEILRMAEKGLANMFSQIISNPDAVSSILEKYPTLRRFEMVSNTILDFVMLSWIIVIWGAYRELNKASRARSFAAFILCGFISVPTFGILLLLTAGGSLTTAPQP